MRGEGPQEPSRLKLANELLRNTVKDNFKKEHDFIRLLRFPFKVEMKFIQDLEKENSFRNILSESWGPDDYGEYVFERKPKHNAWAVVRNGTKGEDVMGVVAYRELDDQILVDRLVVRRWDDTKNILLLILSKLVDIGLNKNIRLVIPVDEDCIEIREILTMAGFIERKDEDNPKSVICERDISGGLGQSWYTID